MAAALRTEQLSKKYGRTVALDGLTLEVEAGEIFGFLGPNGAGKSTTIRLLLDLIRPTAGRAWIAGFDTRRQSHEVRARVGYLPGDLRLYAGLTGEETLAFFGGLRPTRTDKEYVRRLTTALDLDMGRHVNALSKGNRQKLGLLIALMARPAVLLLDEPTSGLDPLIQHAVWEVLREQAASGTTVFFSSHVISEVQEVCARVGILREGRLVAVESVAALRGRAIRHVEVDFSEAAPAPGVFLLAGTRELRRTGRTIELEVSGEMDDLIKALAPYHVTDLRTSQPTLEEQLLTFFSGQGDSR